MLMSLPSQEESFSYCTSKCIFFVDFFVDIFCQIKDTKGFYPDGCGILLSAFKKKNVL